jgi:hypothetical protein
VDSRGCRAGAGRGAGRTLPQLLLHDLLRTVVHLLLSAHKRQYPQLSTKQPSAEPPPRPDGAARTPAAGGAAPEHALDFLLQAGRLESQVS